MRGELSIISRRCKEYREVYAALREQHNKLCDAYDALVIDAARDKQEALDAQAEELMLLRAQLRAREEECVMLKKELAAATTEVKELRPALELFQSQLKAATVQHSMWEIEKKHLQAINARFLLEIKQYRGTVAAFKNEILVLNERIMSDGNISECTKQVHTMHEELGQAKWKHEIYEGALKTLREKVHDQELEIKALRSRRKK